MRKESCKGGGCRPKKMNSEEFSLVLAQLTETNKIMRMTNALLGLILMASVFTLVFLLLKLG